MGRQKTLLATSPSKLAEAFENTCDRSFVMTSVFPHITADIKSTLNVANHLAAAGDELEYRILEDRDSKDADADIYTYNYGVRGNYFPAITGGTRGSKYPLEDFKALLCDMDTFYRKHFFGKKKFYLYQMGLAPTEKFKEDFNFHKDFSFNNSYPDLIQVDVSQDGQSFTLSVIDIKLASHTKIKQKVQITLYALMLDYLLRSLDISNVSVDTSTGFVWHNGNEQLTPFNMAEIIPFVSNFLRNDIYELCVTVSALYTKNLSDDGLIDKDGFIEDVSNVLFHKTSFTCEWCDMYSYCFSREKNSDSIQHTPFLSKFAQDRLYSVKENMEQFSASKAKTATLTTDDLRLLRQNPRIMADLAETKSLNDFLTSFNGEPELLIEKHVELADISRIYDYTKIHSYIDDVYKKNFDKSGFLNWLSSVERQKELDKFFLKDRLDSYQALENSSEYVINYEKKKLDEIEKIENQTSELRTFLSENHSGDELINRLKAYSYLNLAPQKFFVCDKAIVDMPSYEDLALILSVQYDSVTKRAFAMSMYFALPLKKYTDCVELSGIDPGYQSANGYVTVLKTFVVKRDTDVDAVESEFIDSLYELLIFINAGNSKTRNYFDKISLQTYMCSNYEYFNFFDMLYNMLKEGRNFEKVLQLLSYYQTTDTIDLTDIPDQVTSPYTIIILSDIVRKCFVIPAQISYGLDDIANIFCTSSPYHKIVPDYANPLTDAMPSEVIHEYWESYNSADGSFSKPELLNGIVTQLRTRMQNEGRIITGIRRELAIESGILNRKILVSRAYPLSLPGTNCNSSPILAKLDFMTRYESCLSHLEDRVVRIGSIDNAVYNNLALKLVYNGKSDDSHEFRILNQNIEDIKTDASSYVIAVYDDAGISALRGFDENHIFKCAHYVKSNIMTIPFCFDENISIEGNKLYIAFDAFSSQRYTAQQDQFILKSGTTYILCPFFVDFSSKYLIGGEKPGLLSEISDDIDARINNFTVGELRRPCKYPSDINAFLCKPNILYTEGGFYRNQTPVLKDEDKDGEIYKLEKAFANTFTKSQRAAFDQFNTANLSLVLGPPGTGKTNFIGMALLMLLRKLSANGKTGMRVLISANSHAAIDNVLKKLDELQVYNNWRDAYICKLEKEVDGAAISVLKNDSANKDFLHSSINDVTKDRHFVMGSSLQKLSKMYYDGYLDKSHDLFDIIIIDEASQVKLADSLLAISHLRNGGKLLIVGDEEQLAPVIKGTYGDKTQIPYYFGSVFRMLYDYDNFICDTDGKLYQNPAPRYTKTLTEQFRMNDMLSLYSARYIYGPKYRAAVHETIGSQTLKLIDVPAVTETDRIIDRILDPRYPFVLCNISASANTASSEKSQAEVELATAIAKRCYDRLSRSDGNPYTDVTEFWHKGMFVISPHHAHIGKLKRSFAAINNCCNSSGIDFGSEAFIDTVDKMQGQETSLALISYGVNDIEDAILEKEFIFNRNRLNVSITRGKQKMILIMSDTLLEKQIDLLAEEDDSMIQGIAFVNSIKDFAKTSGNELGFDTETADFAFTMANPNITFNIYSKRIAD